MSVWIVLILLFLVLFAPQISNANNIAKNQIPIMSDEWYDSLIGIKEDSTDAIITSWWDFGHWFVSIAERRVTFDGADQGERIHWVGKSLLTSSEETSVGILKMLNCGQEDAPHVLEKYFNNNTPKAVDVLNDIILQNKDSAIKTLKNYDLSDEAIAEVINVTHCEDLIPQYFITSEDMVGKAGVWGHFGAWDFHKAKMYSLVKGRNMDEGLKILGNEFNLTEQEAATIYSDIQAKGGDQWISPWPGYMGTVSATVDGNNVKCSNGIEVDLSDYDVKVPTQQGIMHPSSLVYVTKDDLIEKKFEDSQIGVSIALVPNGKTYECLLADPLLIDSIFTRLFFFDGQGSRYFEKFSDKTTFRGERIIVWKINWAPKEKRIMDALQEKTKAQVGDTASVYYIGWTEEGVFDSSIIDWASKGITKESELSDYENKPFEFTVGTGQVIKGFDNAILGMEKGKEKIVIISPANAYGTDPTVHPLGNKTLSFKLKLVDIS